MTSDFDSRMGAMKQRAHGRWTSILGALGVDERLLNKKNQPCPIAGCGGKDRFQYTDKFGEGNYFCRSCGSGGGFRLAQAVLGLRGGELLDRLERHLGSTTPQSSAVAGGPSPAQMKALCQRIWSEARPVSAGDEVDCYLRNRGLQLQAYPRSLRFHPALGYYEKQSGQKRSKKVAEYPAMLACVQGADGLAVTLHRTYLKEGKKALGGESKKVLSAGINGAAVRLDDAGEELAISEGIETALAVKLSTGKPVWAALNCGNMEKLWIPATVRRVCIYADNDADAEFSGQVSAFALARRLVKESKVAQQPRTVQVFVPRHEGTDWADVLLARLVNEKKAA